MLTGSEMNAVGNLTAPSAVAPPAREATSNRPDGNASGEGASEAETEGVRDTDSVILKSCLPSLSFSSKQSSNLSYEGSPSAQVSSNSAPMEKNVDSNGDELGNSGSCSSNDGPSPSSSTARLMEILPNNSEKQPVRGNYSNWDHQPQGFHGWNPQGFHYWRPQGFNGWQPQGFQLWNSQGFHGDWQKRQGDSSRMVNYGSRGYEHRAGYDRNSYGPQLQLGHLRPPVMLPQMPAATPIVAPPPPPQCLYGPMPNPGFQAPKYILPTQTDPSIGHPNPGFPSQKYIFPTQTYADSSTGHLNPGFPSQRYSLPTYPHPDPSVGGHPFVFPPAPLPELPSMPFSLEAHTRVMIMKQIEYYFSSENLCTDFYLKSHMDSYGWVSIDLIAGFRRIKRLTDNISFILDALIPSAVVEVQGNRIRKRFGWNDWVPKPPKSQNNAGSENKS